MEIECFTAAARGLFEADARLERVVTGFGFVEGPLWDPRSRGLLFSDIPNDTIHRWIDGRVEQFRRPSMKSNGLAWDAAGRLLACEHLGRRVSVTREDGRPEPLAETYGGKRLNSPNDLVLRSDGLLYFTDPPYGIQSADFGKLAEQEQPHNGLYLLRPGAGEPVLLAADFDRPNGLAFSPDERRLYVADTPRYHVRVFDVLPDGTLSGGGEFAAFDPGRGEGRPDGMKVNAEGTLFTTGPGGVWVVAPDREVLAHIRVPEKAANCAWGGEDWSALYITATSSLYRLRCRIPGIPSLRGG